MNSNIFIVNKYRMSESTACYMCMQLLPTSSFRRAVQQALDNCGKPHVFKQNGVWLQLRITR